MAKGTYDDPILCDGIFTKTINGVKKFFKINTSSSVDTSQFVKKSGDTLNGNYFFNDGCNLYKTNKTGTLRLNASNDGQSGARLVLCGKENKEFPAEFNLCANDGTADIQLIGKVSGELFWNNQNIVRSVGGVLANVNGNCDVGGIISSRVGNNYICFEFSNSLKIQIGRFRQKTRDNYVPVVWAYPFKDTNYYVFAMSEDIDDNFDFQIASTTAKNKSNTSCLIAHKVENAKNFYMSGNITVMGIGF